MCRSTRPGWGTGFPARPIVAIGLVVTGVVFTLAPPGVWRSRLTIVGYGVIVVYTVARVYLGVDHPSDGLCALALGSALPVAVFRLTTPGDVFPVTYGRGVRAHLGWTATRFVAINRRWANSGLSRHVTRTLRSRRLRGFDATAPHLPFGNPVNETTLFAKLYALSHLRSDRWYKFTRTIVYGRLEDEKPFSTVRRLAEYEDHMLRLMRDAVCRPRPRWASQRSHPSASTSSSWSSSTAPSRSDARSTRQYR